MWIFNDKLGRWYHPTGQVSYNGPNDPPGEITAEMVTPPAKPTEAPTPSPCLPCGHKTRQVR